MIVSMKNFDLTVEFCEQLDDMHQEIMQAKMHQNYEDFSLDKLQIYDQTGQHLQLDEVHQLFISLKECKIRKLILNGMSTKVVESLLGSISLFNDTFSFLI